MKFLFENNGSSFAVAGNDPSTTTTRDVIIKHCGGSLSRISELNRKYDPLHYVLLHPRGELGWSPEIKEVMPQATAMNYYAYKLAFWYPDYSLHHWSGRLFQQYCVDQYVTIETERLSYILYNQDNFRVEQYYGVVDAYENGVQLGNDTGTIPFQFFPIYLLISYFHDVIFFMDTGCRIVLPTSFIGGPRDMKARFQDAMALVQSIGKPNLFITVTCNPDWPEIKDNLLPGQSAQDRPDLTF
jgi:hypothetical protein